MAVTIYMQNLYITHMKNEYSAFGIKIMRYNEEECKRVPRRQQSIVRKGTKLLLL
jgi:hypothetical protein